MKEIRLTTGQSKLFWTLQFEKDNAIDVGECHGDGALHLWTSKKRAVEEAANFDERAIPILIRVTVLT